MKNDKFLKGAGEFGIDFNAITKVALGDDNFGKELVGLFTTGKNPIIILYYDSKQDAKEVFNYIQTIIENKHNNNVIKLDDFRKG